MLLHVKQNFDKFCPFCHGFFSECEHDSHLMRNSDVDHEEANFLRCGIDQDYCAYNQQFYQLHDNYYLKSKHQPSTKFVDATKKAGNNVEETRNNEGCLYHSGIQLFCSHAHEASTEHGYPAFFWQGEVEIMACEICLAETEDYVEDLPQRRVFSRTTVQPRNLLLPRSMLRGGCDFKQCGSTFWIARKRRLRAL